MNTHIVSGSTGALGAAIVRHLLAEKIHAFVRNLVQARMVLPDGIELVEGDATNSDSILTACADTDVIYHCVNVPYPEWVALMPTITANILGGAKQAGALTQHV